MPPSTRFFPTTAVVLHHRRARRHQRLDDGGAGRVMTPWGRQIAPPRSLLSLLSSRILVVASRRYSLGSDMDRQPTGMNPRTATISPHAVPAAACKRRATA